MQKKGSNLFGRTSHGETLNPHRNRFSSLPTAINPQNPLANSPNKVRKAPQQNARYLQWTVNTNVQKNAVATSGMFAQGTANIPSAENSARSHLPSSNRATIEIKHLLGNTERLIDQRRFQALPAGAGQSAKKAYSSYLNNADVSTSLNQNILKLMVRDIQTNRNPADAQRLTSEPERSQSSCRKRASGAQTVNRRFQQQATMPTQAYHQRTSQSPDSFIQNKDLERTNLYITNITNISIPYQDISQDRLLVDDSAVAVTTLPGGGNVLKTQRELTARQQQKQQQQQQQQQPPGSGRGTPEVANTTAPNTQRSSLHATAASLALQYQRYRSPPPPQALLNLTDADIAVNQQRLVAAAVTQSNPTTSRTEVRPPQQHKQIAKIMRNVQYRSSLNSQNHNLTTRSISPLQQLQLHSSSAQRVHARERHDSLPPPSLLPSTERDESYMQSNHLVNGTVVKHHQNPNQNQKYNNLVLGQQVINELPDQSSSPHYTTVGNTKNNNNTTTNNAIPRSNRSSLSNVMQPQSSAGTSSTTAQFASKELRNYDIGPSIGKGSYAVVKLARDTASGRQVAIKVYDKKILQDPYKMKNVKREISILSKMNHSNIVKLYTVIETTDTLNLVMEYVSSLSLYHYLKQHSQKRLKQEIIKKIFMQVLEGIFYLHERNVVHRDIKLENILIDDQVNIKIIDFGFSVCLRNREQKLTSFCGTPSYMAPEIVSKKDYIGFPVDVWTAGILLYILLCGTFPFKGMDEKDLYKNIRTGKLEIPVHVPLGARILITRILKINPSERPTPGEILEDEWLKSFDSESESESYFQM